jgi:hypothetical protein
LFDSADHKHPREAAGQHHRNGDREWGQKLPGPIHKKSGERRSNNT